MLKNPALVNVGDYVQYTDASNPAKTFKVDSVMVFGQRREFVLLDADGNESRSDLRQQGWVVVDAPLEDTVDGNLGEHDRYAVHITLNDSQDEPGEVYHGPFNRTDAERFARKWDDLGDTEVEDITVIILNPDINGLLAEEDEQDVVNRALGVAPLMLTNSQVNILLNAMLSVADGTSKYQPLTPESAALYETLAAENARRNGSQQ